MLLDLTSFRKAVASLEAALKVAQGLSSSSAKSEEEANVIRAGVIQNFEFTYELCWKFMKRWLENNVGSAYVEGVARRELFRRARESRLITEVEPWMIYHDARNQTAHTYDLAKAGEIFEVATPFLKDAKALLAALESRND